MKCFCTCHGSWTPGCLPSPNQKRLRSVAFDSQENLGASDKAYFGALWPGPHMPLPTLHLIPHGGRRTARGESGGYLSFLYRGRELDCSSPPAQIRTCALTHPAPTSVDDEGQLARLQVLKPLAVTRETPTQDRHRKCVLHCLIGSVEWSFPPTVGFPADTNG